MESYFNQYVAAGGWVMFLIIPCSLVLVTAIVSAMLRLRPSRVTPDYLLEKARRVATKNDRLAYAGAIKEETSALARGTALALQHIDLRAGHQPHRQRLEILANESSAFVSDDLYDSLNVFSTLYTVGPLLGLLGTTNGMINAFRHFGGQGASNVQDLSRGIQEALVATLWGMAIAIPAYVCAQLFYGKVRKFERERLPRMIAEIVRAMFHGAPEQQEDAPAAAEPPAARAAAAPPATASAKYLPPHDLSVSGAGALAAESVR